MTSEQLITIFLIYNAWRRQLSMNVKLDLRTACRRFLITQPKPLVCGICGGRVFPKQRTVDHIIPISIAKDLGLVGLLFDPRNMRPAHERCNTRRRNKIHDLPESVVAKLKELGYSVA